MVQWDGTMGWYSGMVQWDGAVRKLGIGKSWNIILLDALRGVVRFIYEHAFPLSGVFHKQIKLFILG
jgi:hypothetical protein